MSLDLAARRRSVLSVPADDPRKIAKALAAGADEVVVDREDAVAVPHKDRARAVVATAEWPVERPLVAVRVNGIDTPWFEADVLAAVVAGADSIVLPKAESRADVARAEALLVDEGRGVAIQALIETAAGLAGLADITSVPDRLASVVLGYADLAASLGRRQVDPGRWVVAQELVLLHARAAGIAAVDGPYLGVDDDAAFRGAVGAVSAAGFDAKWVIHPRQVPAVNAAFVPSEEAVEHAQRVLEALAAAETEGRGAVQLDGQLLDGAMAVHARRVLGKAVR
ncbi:CoA ester lyase [Nocardioides sp. NPDC092400]|uniref:HpcH/HpaI aldolase/citrate lyase family protein n=1 Tax=Nocardioides sp. NPDC092400 TaxID=3155196 RepID=UPI003437541B